MRLSESFTKPLRSAPKDAAAANARLLIQGGFVDQMAAGIYNLLPLGWRVYRKIAQIIREEMDAIGGQELNLAALHPKAPWEASGRWTEPGTEVMYQFKDAGGRDYGLGWTHEEVIAGIATTHIQSYRDLPNRVYQIQVKFRNEPRARSGVLRGREFIMKDLYSFDRDQAGLDAFYEQAKAAYGKVFERVGLDAWIVEASGGDFTKYSHEFQVFAESGEDLVYYAEDRSFAQNAEIFHGKAGETTESGAVIKRAKAIEVGNIFKLGTRFSEALGASYLDEHGKRQPIVMGSYGIGPTRLIGALVEVSHDAAGIIWPAAVAPYAVHLLSLGTDPLVKAAADQAYAALSTAGVETLYDDRDESAGVKFNDADLLGIPQRVTISQSTLKSKSAELKPRASDETESVSLADLPSRLNTK